MILLSFSGRYLYYTSALNSFQAYIGKESLRIAR